MEKKRKNKEHTKFGYLIGLGLSTAITLVAMEFLGEHAIPILILIGGVSIAWLCAFVLAFK